MNSKLNTTGLKHLDRRAIWIYLSSMVGNRRQIFYSYTYPWRCCSVTLLVDEAHAAFLSTLHQRLPYSITLLLVRNMVTFQWIGMKQPNFLHIRLYSLYIRSPKMYCCSRTINLTHKVTFLLTSITKTHIISFVSRKIKVPTSRIIIIRTLLWSQMLLRKMRQSVRRPGQVPAVIGLSKSDNSLKRFLHKIHSILQNSHWIGGVKCLFGIHLSLNWKLHYHVITTAYAAIIISV